AGNKRHSEKRQPNQHQHIFNYFTHDTVLLIRQKISSYLSLSLAYEPQYAIGERLSHHPKSGFSHAHLMERGVGVFRVLH
ncbi:hypothetical protein V6O07_08095, partial [Arthrospira platensis SPKY2]